MTQTMNNLGSVSDQQNNSRQDWYPTTTVTMTLIPKISPSSYGSTIPKGYETLAAAIMLIFI